MAAPNNTLLTPVYCKDCNSTNSWERYPTGGWVFESGKIFEYAYKCHVCGAITLRPKVLQRNCN